MWINANCASRYATHAQGLLGGEGVLISQIVAAQLFKSRVTKKIMLLLALDSGLHHLIVSPKVDRTIQRCVFFYPSFHCSKLALAAKFHQAFARDL